MSQPTINPENINKPFQLLAAWLVALILLDTAFLTAATQIQTPEWIPGALVFSAITFVPFFIACIFMMQTKFRAEMLDDEYYLEYIRRKFESKYQDKLSKELPISIGGELTPFELSPEKIKKLEALELSYELWRDLKW